MPDLILTPEQARLLSGVYGQVTIRDPDGSVIGHMEPILTPQVAAELKRRAREGPWFTSEQVKARLAALEAEWERTGGFGQDHLQAFLAELDERDPPHAGTRGPTG